jgi:geranylgeranyl pyrophosphate synthase
MTDSDLKAVFSQLSTLGQSAESKMHEFLLKEVHSKFKDLVVWQTDTGGKRLRPALTLLFAKAFGAPYDDPKALSAAAGIELIHTYSLILDDIIDRGDLRRGKQTTRAKYGDEFAILSAIIHREAVYEAAKATDEHFSDTIDLYSQTIRKLTEGERLDILFEQKDDREHDYFRTHRYKEVTLNDYRTMIAGKTASLITAACTLGAIIGGASQADQEKAGEYGRAAGIAFQIADDYLDIFAVSDKFGKEVYKDIIEQKLGNFVIVKALQLLQPKDSQLFQKYLTDRKLSDKERVEKCIPLLEKSKVKEVVMKEAEEWSSKAISKLGTIQFKDDSVKTILEKVAEFTVKRAF